MLPRPSEGLGGAAPPGPQPAPWPALWRRERPNDARPGAGRGPGEPPHQTPLLLQPVTELLDHRIRQDFPGHLLDSPLGFLDAAIGVEIDLKVLALPHIADPSIAQRGQRAADSLALRVEHRLLQRHVDKGFHRMSTAINFQPSAIGKTRAVLLIAEG